MENNQKGFQIKGNSWGAIAILVVAFIGVFFVARGIFWLLNLVAPILLIAALIIDYKVLINYVKWLVDLTKRNVLIGLVAIVLSIIGYPIVFAFLLGRALMNRKVKEIEKQERAHREGELVDYEELELENPPPIEVPNDESDSARDDLV